MKITPPDPDTENGGAHLLDFENSEMLDTYNSIVFGTDMATAVLFKVSYDFLIA